MQINESLLGDIVAEEWSKAGRYRRPRSRWAGGKENIKVVVDDTPGIFCQTFKEWSKNGKWSGISVTRKIILTPRWKENVYDHGLAVVEGHFVLDAVRVSEENQFSVYKAIVVVPRRGLNLGVESKHIAKEGPFVGFAMTPRRAMERAYYRMKSMLAQ